MEESKEVRELLDSKQYTRLRQMLAELNDADIAVLLEELEEQDMLKVSVFCPRIWRLTSFPIWMWTISSLSSPPCQKGMPRESWIT